VRVGMTRPGKLVTRLSAPQRFREITQMVARGVHKVVAPLRVAVTKKKMFTISWNNMKNCHFQVYNKAKKEYGRLMRDQITTLPKMSKVIITYRLFPKTKRLCDLDNFAGGTAKFFQDSLVSYGKIPDDNYKFVIENHFLFGEVDKVSPRMEITIEEVD
jgi:hypothetical protein